MKFYSIDWRTTNALPTRVFWAMYRNIQPIQAEESLRMLRLLRTAVVEAPKDSVNEFIRDQEFELERVMIPDYDAEAAAGRAKLKELADRFGGG